MPKKTTTATRDETVEAILRESDRVGERAPLRNAFLQAGTRGVSVAPGPFAEFVRRGRETALEQYLLAVAWATAAPYDVTRDSRIWARAIGVPMDESGRAAVSRNWTFLKELKLVRVERKRRMASVTLLREDGSGQGYTHPFQQRNPRYFGVPFAYWRDGYHRKLKLPGKALLLVGLSLPDRFALPGSQSQKWYGLSESTLRRGVRELMDAELLKIEREMKTAPLAPTGETLVSLYTLLPPFGPKKFDFTVL